MHEVTNNMVLSLALSRYDIAGVHVDDFYFPAPVAGHEFPDENTYQSYLQEGGTLSKDNWRKHSVSHFITRLQNVIKSIKPDIKFSLDTLGLYRETYDMTKREEESYYGYYTTQRSASWPKTHIQLGDFLSPRLEWPLEVIAEEEGKVDIGPVLQDWRYNFHHNSVISVQLLYAFV